MCRLRRGGAVVRTADELSTLTRRPTTEAADDDGAVIEREWCIYILCVGECLR